MRGDDELRYVRTGRDPSLPRRQGKLRVVSTPASGCTPTWVAGPDGFPVAVSDESFEFAIYPDGRIRMTDGAGTYEAAWRTGTPLITSLIRRFPTHADSPGQTSIAAWRRCYI